MLAHTAPLIRLDRVAKTYIGTAGDGARAALRAALRDVSLQVWRGEIVGIAGRTGAGKSTLLRMINRLETPDSGAVFVDGRDLSLLPARELRLARRNIGMIFQHDHLLHKLNVYDNIALPLRLHGTLNAPRLARRVRECLDLLDIADKAARYPAQLSGNQQRRVAIARALASQPDILLCDEPTSALDADTTRGLLATLRDLNARLGMTIVIVSPDLPALATLCRRMAVLEDGVVAETFALADTSTPRRTALGRELAFHRTEAGAALAWGALHA